MSEVNQGQPANQPKLELIMPALPELYDGAFEDEYAKYESDLFSFTISFMDNISLENPELVELFYIYGVSNIENISSHWPMIYYEMFAESSRREGIPPMKIQSDTYIRIAKQRTFDIENSAKNIDLILNYLKRRINGVTQRVKRDRFESPELGKFWNAVNDDALDLRNQGAELPDVLQYLSSLHLIQEVMQKQHDEYALTGEYLGDKSFSS